MKDGWTNTHVYTHMDGRTHMSTPTWMDEQTRLTKTDGHIFPFGTDAYGRM